MTKKLNLSAITILVVTFLLSISCTQDNDMQEMATFQRNFNIKQINLKTSKANNFNYQIDAATSTIDFTDKQINLEVPVPLNDFQFTQAYNVSTDGQPAILLVITRNDTKPVIDLPTQYIIETNISFDEVNLNTDLLENNTNLNIFVMNTTKVFSNDTEAATACYNAINNTMNRTDSADGPDETKKGYIIL